MADAGRFTSAPSRQERCQQNNTAAYTCRCYAVVAVGTYLAKGTLQAGVCACGSGIVTIELRRDGDGGDEGYF